MKKIYLLLGICLLCAVTLQAQYSTNRTTKTIVADIWAQMPSQQSSQYNTMMKDLASAGEEGVLLLIKMIDTTGENSNAQVEYALSGLSHYVSTEDQTTNRMVVSNAYIKALDMVSDREVKAFIIRQLQIVGKDEAVAKLSTYLDDERLSGPASRALVSIGTDSSAKTLLNGLSVTSNKKSKKDIIEAIAEMQIDQAENKLRPMLGSGDENTQKLVLYALSRVGSTASLKELASAAEKINYAMENTGATDAYITLIKRILSQGNIKEAEKAAVDLMKKADKAGQMQVCESALQIQMAAKPSDAVKLLQKALKSNNRDYRYAALNFASEYADENMYGELFKLLKNNDNEVNVDILNWMEDECDIETNRNTIENIGFQILVQKLSSPSSEVKEAAVGVLSRIGGDKAIDAITSLLANNDEQVISFAEKFLNTTKGDISSSVVSIIPSATDAGKMAGLRLLSNRKSSKNENIVIEQINHGSYEVKKVAYAGLKNVVSIKNLETLYGLLENAQPEFVPDIHQAIIVAINVVPSDARLDMVTIQMNNAPKDKQYLYYSVLASVQDKKSLNLISTKFAEESGVAKDAAFQALLDWKGKDVGNILLAICKNPTATNYFERALDRYIQLASSSDLTGENRRLLLTNALEVAKTDKQKNEIIRQLGQTNSFLGMILASKYLDQPAMQQSAAGAIMTIALGNKEITGKIVKDLLNKVIQVLDNPDAGYQKEAIGKHLKEMPDEEGFIQIYNEKDLTGWKGIVENPISRAKMKATELVQKQAKADEVAIAHWIPQGDILMFDGVGGDNLCTIKQYGDFEMYIDWNLDPAGPEADAGIYLRGTPQVQIWDTSRVNVGAQVGSGGLYNNEVHPSKPLKVADNKLGEWNTFYIKMVKDRVTVKLNGELVTDNIILENFWDRSLPIFTKEQIELQAHGSKVYYRNIYVKELEETKPYELTAEEKEEGFRVLFDGTNMHNWTGNTIDYFIEDGCISLDPKGNHGGNLFTKEEFSDFIFRFEFQLTPAANNGLGIRTPMEGDAAYEGMELQILDNEAPAYSDLAPYQYHGSVYGIIAAKRGYLKPIGEWNYQEVIANGDDIKITLNGMVILDGNLKDATRNGTPDKKEHPGLFNKKGHIGFLGHGSAVKFKNIRIKELIKK
jgi:HEAT repeat protein